MFVRTEIYIMQMLKLIERWAEDPNGFSVIEKVTNGGKGSGNYGHYGRPGLVGGSTPINKLSGFEVNLNYGYDDIVKGKDIAGRSFGGRINLAKEAGNGASILFLQDSEPIIANDSDVEIEKDGEKQDFKTSEQQKALDEIFSMIDPDGNNMRAYFDNNCSPEVAVALAQSLKEAKESGIDFSWAVLSLSANEKYAAEITLEPHFKEGSMPLEFENYTFLYEISPRVLNGGDSLARDLRAGNTTGLTTGGNLSEIFAHENAHMKMANLCQQKYGYGFTKNDWDSFNQSVVKKACKNIGISSELDKLGSQMSRYGKTDYSEVIGESFGKPSYSDLTKEVVNVVNGIKDGKIELNAGRTYKSFKLCSGIPFVKMEKEKSINGGKGSGNFGHYGRPGEVGGSAPSPQGIPVSKKQNPSSAYLIKHKDEIMARMGYNEALFQSMVDDVRAIEIQDKAIEKADVEKWEKEYRPELERLGISQGTIDTVDKIVRRHADKNESTRTEGQAEAIDNLISDTGVILAKGDETYMRNSVPEEMVNTIHDELNKAKKDGIDVSKVQLQFVTATQQSGNCTLGQNGVIKIRLNRREHSDLNYFREKLKDQYGKKWWTADDIGASIRHELGHAMVWQVIKDCNMNIARYNEVAVSTVKRANREWVRKTGKSQTELENNKGFKYMSQYGRSSSHEALAEAYAGENYSDYTKILANELRWAKRYY